MITKGEFIRVQQMLGRDGVNLLIESERPESRPKTRQFALTGCIKCAECGCAITAEFKTKRSRKRGEAYYTYYHCSHRRDGRDYRCPQRSNIEGRALEQQVADLLSNIRIDNDFLEWARAHLKKDRQKEKSAQVCILDNLKRRINIEEKKCDRLFDLAVSDVITQADFERRQQTYKETISALKLELDRAEQQVAQANDTVEEAFNFAAGAKG